MPKGGKKKGGQKSEAPKEEPVEEVPPPKEEEDDGPGAKRKQKKEKKQQQELARLAMTKETPSTSRQQSVPPAEEPKPEPPPKVEPKVEAKVEEVAEEMDGLGLGGSKKRRPKKKKADVPATESAPVIPNPAQIPASSSFPPPRPAPHSAPITQTAPPVVSWRAGGKGDLPSSQTMPQITPEANVESSRQYQAPQPSSQQYPQQQQRPQQSAPQPTYTSLRPAQPMSRSTVSAYSQENIQSRYKIPLKIEGRSVRSRRLNVLTNYLEMNFEALKISRYDVSFTPDRPKKMIPLVFKKVKEVYYPNELLAFDQTKNCYSLRPLKNVPPNERWNTTVEVNDANGRLMKFEVSLKATGVVELDKIKRYMRERGTSVLHPTEEVQCIDVILRQGTLESYVKAGRQFFKRPARPIDLGHGYEMWTGLFQSAIFTSKAFINIDVAHKGFPKHQTMVEALVNDFRFNTNNAIENQRNYEFDNFLQFIKGLRVVATLVGSCPTAGQKREYICNGLAHPPGKQKFMLNEADGKFREITVGEYFATEKKYQIKYPHLNCLWVGPKEKSIFFPMELLSVAYGQPLARQLNETQVAKMVREAATPPDQRLQKITEVISSMKYPTNQDFKRFGLEISDKFYEVTAKVLDPPSLDIGRGAITPRKGCWQANSLLKAEQLLSWGFLAVECSPNNDFESCIQMIASTGRQMGMNIAAPALKNFNLPLTSLHAILRTALEKGIKFLFVVVSARGRDHYHKVKQLAEREVGMLTQCLKEATVRKMNLMTAKNILLKVNSKLMGINQALGDKTMPRCLQGGGVMIIGADVTHPSPDQSNVPSIAAVTASIDAKCYMYNIELSVQTPKKEMIVQFEDMMFDHLKVYRDRNNHLPRKIFVFRDGVSEGQFVQVMNSELAAVHAAYARIAGASKKPEILFLLVQKRHHTRFFNKGQNCQYNVEPGTVVDTDIVHASELDFYLVSHQALKGTARPTRYHAVCNDGKIPDDEVEQLTYYLCHLYSRCMRSVSYPTPTYYAHLACLRARSLTYGQKFNNKDLEKKPERLHVLDKMLQYSRMFFV